MRGFSALQIGLAIFSTGVFQVMAIPVYTVLARRIDLRWLMMFGLGLFGFGHLPQILPLDPAIPPRERPLYRAGKFLHDVVFQWSLYAIFAAHIAGVVKHRFVDGDRGFVRRMWGRPGAN